MSATISLRQHGAGLTGKAGEDGWTPVLSVLEDGERRIQQIINWEGGQGEKPVAGWFVGETGFVDNISAATDIRGSRGDKGETGSSAEPESITENELADGAVVESKISDGAVTEEKLAINSISSEKIKAGAVTEEKLADKSVTNSKLADMPESTIKGAIAAGQTQDLIPEQVRQITGQGWRVLSNVKVATPVGAVIFEVPNEVATFRISGFYQPSAADSLLYLRVSIDGGATYISDPAFYVTTAAVSGGAGTVTSGSQSSASQWLIGTYGGETSFTSFVDAYINHDTAGGRLTLHSSSSGYRKNTPSATFIQSRYGWTKVVNKTIPLKFMLYSGSDFLVPTHIIVEGC